MAENALEDALRLAQGRAVFVATADSEGLPHVACAGRLALDPQGCVLVTEWFCPGTMENVEENPQVALVVWDEEADRGYQMLGIVERMEEVAVLNGVGAPREGHDVPQVERRLAVRVNVVMEFCRAQHTDTAARGGA
jgi:predicted pyridoxine 5'-phosphate oxidase superfamily flavin-nucleotide-binding protein